MRHSTTLNGEPRRANQLEEQMLCYAKRPCPFPPGSAEKIAVLTLRAGLRLPLFVQGDYTDTFAVAPGRGHRH